MPDHTTGTALLHLAGRTGRTTQAPPGATNLVVIVINIFPPSVGFVSGLPLGPYYGLGHYYFRNDSTTAMGHTVPIAGGPLRYVWQGIPFKGLHYGNLEVWVAPGGNYDVWFCG